MEAGIMYIPRGQVLIWDPKKYGIKINSHHHNILNKGKK